MSYNCVHSLGVGAGTKTMDEQFSKVFDVRGLYDNWHDINNTRFHAYLKEMEELSAKGAHQRKEKQKVVVKHRYNMYQLLRRCQQYPFFSNNIIACEALFSEFLNRRMLAEFKVLPYSMRFPTVSHIQVSHLTIGSWVLLRRHTLSVVVGFRCDIGRHSDAHYVRFEPVIRYREFFNERRQSRLRTRACPLTHLHPITIEMRKKWALRKIKPLLMNLREHCKWKPGSVHMKKSAFMELGEQKMQDAFK